MSDGASTLPSEARILLEALETPAAWLDDQGRVRAANGAWQSGRMVPGMPDLAAPLGSPLREVWAEAGAAPGMLGVLDAVTSARSEEEVVESVLRGPGGREGALWSVPSSVETRARRLGDGMGVLVTLRDLSRLAIAEDQLRISRSRLRSVIAGAPIVLFGLDPEGIFTVVEGVGASGLGATPELLLGRSVFEVYAHLPALLEGVRAALLGETAVRSVQIGRLTYELRFSPALDGDQLRGVIGVATDITERARIEQMKNEFVSVVSHELRTPLTSIRGSLGLLEGGIGGALDERGAELVRIARSNSERLIRLINDILDLDKLEAGRLEFHSQPVDVDTLFERAIEALAGSAETAKVSLVRELPEAAPRVLVDLDRMIQVLVNLGSNALKFSPAGGAVVFSARPLGSHRVRFEVRDSGPGIPSDQRERLFKKFQQLSHEGHRQVGGSGLGLSISKAIVEAHNGRIDVDSVEGRGSTFYFELPALESPAARPARARAAGHRGRTVELEVGHIPNPNEQSLELRAENLAALVEEAATTTEAAVWTDAHAEATIFRATAPDADDAMLSVLDDLIEGLTAAVRGQGDPEALIEASLALVDLAREVQRSAAG